MVHITGFCVHYLGLSGKEGGRERREKGGREAERVREGEGGRGEREEEKEGGGEEGKRKRRKSMMSRGRRKGTKDKGKEVNRREEKEERRSRRATEAVTHTSKLAWMFCTGPGFHTNTGAVSLLDGCGSSDAFQAAYMFWTTPCSSATVLAHRSYTVSSRG